MTTTLDLERRTITQPVEIRAASDGAGIVATGYAAVFNKLSKNLGGFVERFAPGAFAKTIAEQDVTALFNHDPAMVLGRRDAGTLRLEEDGTGLRYEIDLDGDTGVGRDVRAMLKRGDLYGSSIGFRALEDEWGVTDQDFPLRTVSAATLRDLGPVTFAAYSDTTAALRSLAETRHLDLDDLVAAANTGALRSLLEPDADVDDRPPAIVHRRPAAWFV